VITHQEFFGFLSVILGFAAAFLYWRSIYKGQTKPHPFTFLVWFILAAIGAVAQINDNAGPGAWVSISTALICLITMIWAYKLGDIQITRSDWISLWTSLAIIPIWMITNNAVWAVILVSLIDFIGFIPTIRKSWERPETENLSAWSINIPKLGFSLLAMNNFTFVTVFYPASFMVLNVLFIAMCYIRRSQK
jgi:hypothetical protein